MGFKETAHLLEAQRQTQIMDENRRAQGIDGHTPGRLRGQRRFVFWVAIIAGFAFPPLWLLPWYLARQQRKFTALFDTEHPFVPSPTGWRPNPGYTGQIAPGQVPPGVTMSSAGPTSAHAEMATATPVEERLARLTALRDAGQITDEEYQEQRSRILGGI